MNKLYCIAHLQDAAWMIGEQYNNSTWHAVKHQGYDADAMKQNVPANHVVIETSIKDGKRYKVSR